jgi:uncharacterized membrane protein YkoI
VNLTNVRGAVVTAGVTALAVAGVAGAATKHTTSSSSTSGSSPTSTAGAHNETLLTGAKLKSASDAAIAANPGATIRQASTEDHAGKAAYEVKITEADGTRAEVLEDSSFTVLSTKADTGHGGRGGHRGGNPNETALTGADLAKAKAAAEAAVSGGTADRASTEDPAESTGAAYEVEVSKTDGSHVKVLLGSSFSVIKTVADTHTHG